MPFCFFVLFLLKGNGKRVAVATCRIYVCVQTTEYLEIILRSFKGEDDDVGRKGLKRKTSLLT